MTHLYPMRIKPRFDERIWGGHNLARRLGKDAPAGKLIGESWEVYEENPVVNGPFAGRTIGQLRQDMGSELMGHVPASELFPLLTKLIDAQDVLSVQVHPTDRFARELEGQPYGKTECWYVIEAAPGAALTYGFNQNTSPEEYTRLVADGRLEEILRELPVGAGDVVYLPAGTVHAIGAGIILYELQQTSDITYRIYDWNRRDASGKTRELHVEKARQVLDYHRSTRGKVTPLHDPQTKRTVLIASHYFCMEIVQAGTGQPVGTYDSVVAICALDTPVTLQLLNGESVDVPRYSSALVPAAAGSYTVESTASNGNTASALIAYVPQSDEAIRRDLLDRGFHPDEVSAFVSQFAPVI